jgi:Fe2+ transport system protein B
MMPKGSLILIMLQGHWLLLRHWIPMRILLAEVSPDSDNHDQCEILVLQLIHVYIPGLDILFLSFAHTHTRTPHMPPILFPSVYEMYWVIYSHMQSHVQAVLTYLLSLTYCVWMVTVN